MKIDVWVEKENRNESIELGKGARIFDVLEVLGINPETIISMKNGELVMEDEPLKHRDRLELRSVKIPG